MNSSETLINLRKPTSEDGWQVNRLIAECPPLDTNSLYCNLLQCSHFSATSVAADLNGELVGFISGYLLQDRPDTLFIWQVAVSDKARGQGLATKMLDHILSRRACKRVNWLETTITGANRASWALFESLASRLETDLVRSVMFDQEEHFKGEHDTEFLIRIGPFSNNKYPG